MKYEKWFLLLISLNLYELLFWVVKWQKCVTVISLVFEVYILCSSMFSLNRPKRLLFFRFFIWGLILIGIFEFWFIYDVLLHWQIRLRRFSFNLEVKVKNLSVSGYSIVICMWNSLMFFNETSGASYNIMNLQ